MEFVSNNLNQQVNFFQTNMAQNFVVTGKFLGSKATQFVGQNNYAIRAFFVDLTENPDFPNTPEFQLKGDKVNLVDSLQKGQQVQVKFNLDGRKYVNKEGREAVATNLTAWQINVITSTSAAVTPPPAPRPVPAAAPTMSGPGQYAQTAQTAVATQDEENDLPF